VKYRKRPALTAREIQLLILIGIVSGIVLGTLVGADIQLSRGLTGGGGFFAPWEAARQFIFQHKDPYGVEVRQLAETLAYGGPAGARARPYIVTMPFFALLAYFPIAALSDPVHASGIGAQLLNAFSDPATARGVWMFINEAALVGTAFLSLSLVDWKPGRLLRIGYALLSVFGVYSVVSLIEGGPAILLGFLYVAVLFAYVTEQDELAGALLVFTLFSWEIGLLFVPFVLWKSIYDKRWRVLAGFGMVLTVLLIVSFIVYPGWVFPFISATLAVLRAQFGVTSREILLHLWPAYGLRAAQALTVFLVVMLLYEWAATRHADIRRFMWAACLTLAITPLIGVRTEVANLVVLFPALALILSAIAGRWRTGNWLAGLLLLAVFLLPWAWFIRWYLLGDARAYDFMVLFLPAFTIAALYWTRWWFLRPPRTWIENARTALSATRPLSTARRLPVSTE
jgi:hypothetical protein